MQMSIVERGVYRRLWSSEVDLLKEHLLRLDRTARRMRFAHDVNDQFIADYVEQTSSSGGAVYAYFEDGLVRAVAELRKLGPTWGDEAEAAFSVEAPYQDRGIGTELMTRLVRAAGNKGVRRIHMSCLADNLRMRAIAHKECACLEISYGEAVANIVPDNASYLSFLAEVVEERVGFLFAVIELQQRLSRRT